MKHTILLLEDDADLIDGLTYSLSKNGYFIDVAQTVKTAYDCLKRQTYSLLFAGCFPAGRKRYGCMPFCQGTG